MPIYEYVCTLCGRPSEVIHGIHTPGPTTCEVCGGTLRKAISTPSIVFKGSGWAKKDSRSSAYQKASAAADAPAVTDSSSTKDSGTKDSTAKDSATKADAPGPKDSPSAGGSSSGADAKDSGAKKSGSAKAAVSSTRTSGARAKDKSSDSSRSRSVSES